MISSETTKGTHNSNNNNNNNNSSSSDNRETSLRLASGWNNGTIKIWHLSAAVAGGCECERTLYGHTGSITAIESLSQVRVASGSYDSTVRIWNVTSGECERTLRAHNDSIFALAFFVGSFRLGRNFFSTTKNFQKNILFIKFILKRAPPVTQRYACGMWRAANASPLCSATQARPTRSKCSGRVATVWPAVATTPRSRCGTWLVTEANASEHCAVTRIGSRRSRASRPRCWRADRAIALCACGAWTRASA